MPTLFLICLMYFMILDKRIPTMPLPPRYYKCTTCLKVYFKRNSFYYHTNYMCGKEPKFLCPAKGCYYKGKLKQQVKRHLRYYHKYSPEHVLAFKINKID